jgi:hypothetical protein
VLPPVPAGCLAPRDGPPRRQLPAGGLGPVKHPGNLRERHVEDVVKQESRALQRRQPVQRQQQRQREVAANSVAASAASPSASNTGSGSQGPT